MVDNPAENHPSPLPYRTWIWVTVLAIAWGVPGLIGHDPWKPEEAAAFGVVFSLLQGGSWIDLQLAGESLPGTAPLFYWVCALTAKLFGGMLPLHDAARLGAGILSAGCVAFLVAATRRFCGDRAGIAAFLICLGSIGFIPEAHQMSPGLTLLLGYCVALYGLSRWDSRPRAGGLWLGLGIGIVFLGEGWAHTLVLIFTVALLPLFFAAWRGMGQANGIGFTVLGAAPFLLLWPYVLFTQAPDQLDDWFRLGAHFRDVSLVNLAKGGYTYTTLLVWQAAPSWPLAFWALWSTRRTFKEDRALQAGLLVFATAFVTLVHDAQVSEGHRLILLPGLILLAARGIDTVRRGAGHALMWFSVMFFFLFALTGWYYWMGFDLTFPDRLHRHVTRMQPGYEISELGLRVALAVALTAGWCLVMLRMRRCPSRPLLAWTAGATLIWGLLMSLYINYLDTGRSYRQLAGQIRAALPAQHGCVAGHNLGPSQRAMFHYFGGLITLRAGGERPPDCQWLLAQSQRKARHRPEPGWNSVFAGTRPGDKNEWYELFSKAP